MTEPYIELQELLKLLGWVGTGGEAKVRIQGGEVWVDGEVETRRRRKLRPGNRVRFAGQEHALSEDDWSGEARP